MSGTIERTCLYCGQRLAADQTVAMCSLCFAGHHEECWRRNGRCSTFRCPGQPKLVTGDEYGRAFLNALESANASPSICPMCGNRVYSGTVCLRRLLNDSTGPGGLTFVSHDVKSVGGAKGVLARVRALRHPRWVLSGIQLRGRSCGGCRTFFLWGRPVDEKLLGEARQQSLDRFCVHCGTSMSPGELLLADGKFWCDTVPDFHTEWLLHQVLDRFVYNRWPLPLKAIPAASCAVCHYTEICGRPVYRVS